ncbi:hypothetical protein [Gordonia jinghuaiqii]|uniref:hypothetical protein n=1 Tax=Gordonia jinghuaiqii TaxID=2758710 RepID=UPI002948C281|nr:hypothetical protein [Gordonia jinghuaiqii]
MTSSDTPRKQSDTPRKPYGTPRKRSDTRPGRPSELPAGAPPARPMTRRVAGGRLSIATVALVVALVAVAVLWRDSSAGESLQRNRDELRERAGTIVAEVFSVDSAHWRADRARARDLVAGEFVQTYGTQLDRPPEPGTLAVAWRPEIVSIVETDAAEGRALLRVAVTVRGESAPEVTVSRSILARFIRSDDTWLLAAADVIG